MSDPFLEHVLVEGLGGVFTSVVGSECLHSVSRPVLHFGYPPGEDLERFVFGLDGISPDFPCTIIYKCDEVPGAS